MAAGRSVNKPPGVWQFNHAFVNGLHSESIFVDDSGVAAGHDPAGKVRGDQDHAASFWIHADVSLPRAGPVISTASAAFGFDHLVLFQWAGLALVGFQSTGFVVCVDLSVQLGPGLLLALLIISMCHGSLTEKTQRHRDEVSQTFSLSSPLTSLFRLPTRPSDSSLMEPADGMRRR